MRSSLPDFPWDSLAPFGDIARKYSDGAIDLSIGTPVDPTPQFIQDALIAHSDSPRYPLTMGTPELREAMRNWAVSRLEISGEFDVLPLVGSKELVAWLPTYLESKKVLYPKIAYPTYLVGSILASAENHAVDIDASTWPSADLAWINSPSNPTGRVHSADELREVIAWSRKNSGIVVSDECYLDFGHSATPTSIFKYSEGHNQNILAVHSLSKRSSMAGYRAAMLVGDSALIKKVLEIRKHGGGMVPLPVQFAMTAALGDEQHVATQRLRYNERRTKLSKALITSGFTIDESAAGLYVWATRHEDCWKTIAWLAERGIIATPGSFYGQAGAYHVRIALTATDRQIEDAAQRLVKAY